MAMEDVGNVKTPPPGIAQWANGPTERTGKRLLQMLRIILTGSFPDHRNNYAPAPFEALLAKHRQGTLHWA